MDKSTAKAYAGALAEVQFADAVAGLGPEWTVLDAVPLGPLDPDSPGDAVAEHVLIGPPGVFSVAIRNHVGERVWVGERTFIADGTRFPHLSDAEHVADLVSARLAAAVAGPVAVTSCLVVAAPAELRFGGTGRRVDVVVPDEVAGWLGGLPRLLSPTVLDTYRAAARDPDTWSQPGDVEFGACFRCEKSRCETCRRETTSDRAAFDAVRRDVLRARRLRLAWVLLGLVVSQVSLLLSMTTALGLARH
jgi:hypothetical protein